LNASRRQTAERIMLEFKLRELLIKRHNKSNFDRAIPPFIRITLHKLRRGFMQIQQPHSAAAASQRSGPFSLSLMKIDSLSIFRKLNLHPQHVRFASTDDDQNQSMVTQNLHRHRLHNQYTAAAAQV